MQEIKFFQKGTLGCSSCFILVQKTSIWQMHFQCPKCYLEQVRVFRKIKYEEKLLSFENDHYHNYTLVSMLMKQHPLNQYH